jgi:hypothetical protein
MLQIPHTKPISFLPFAACCTVLRSRWCQSGVKPHYVPPADDEASGDIGPVNRSPVTTPTKSVTGLPSLAVAH